MYKKSSSIVATVLHQVDARNVDGSTPLCEACSAGSLECVRLLLDHGAKVNPALTSRTASPLHEACMGGGAPVFSAPWCFDITPHAMLLL